MAKDRETGGRKDWINRLKPGDVTSIMDAAVRHRRSGARFVWGGHKLVVQHTTFRALVDTVDGKPVCCRYL
jgi:hypothetical protein